jgi:hypothetical protein
MATAKKMPGIFLPNTEHLVSQERLQGRLGDGGDGDGIAHGIEYLDGVAVLAVRNGVVIDDLDDIAAAQTF